MKLLTTAAIAAALCTLPATAACHGNAAKTADATAVRYVSHHEEKADIAETAAAAGNFKTLLAAAEAAGLVEALKGDGPLTVFAPTDAAFAALPAGTVETLLKPENKDKLAGILKLHVIAGSKVLAADLTGKSTTAETLNGTVSIDGTNGVTVNGAKVISADVMASNGVIHVIDAVLLPAS